MEEKMFSFWIVLIKDNKTWKEIDEVIADSNLHISKHIDFINELWFYASDNLINKIDNKNVQKIQLQNCTLKGEDSQKRIQINIDSWTIKGNKVYAINPRKNVSCKVEKI